MDYFNTLYAKAKALIGWGLVVRILGWVLAGIYLFAGLISASSSYDSGGYFFIVLLVSALTVVGSSFVALLLEVIGMTAQATVDSATSKKTSQPEVNVGKILNEIKNRVTEDVLPANEKNPPAVTQTADTSPIGPWVCLYCGKENLECDNICNNCGKKKAE